MFEPVSVGVVVELAILASCQEGSHLHPTEDQRWATGVTRITHRALAAGQPLCQSNGPGVSMTGTPCGLAVEYGPPVSAGCTCTCTCRKITRCWATVNVSATFRRETDRVGSIAQSSMRVWGEQLPGAVIPRLSGSDQVGTGHRRHDHCLDLVIFQRLSAQGRHCYCHAALGPFRVCGRLLRRCSAAQDPMA